MTEDAQLETLVGRKIEGYQILKRIGKGGFGRVYLALNPETKQKVAMKLMDIDEDKLVYIDREIAMLGSITHPHIVKMFHHKRVNNQQLIFLEFVEGGSLRDHLTKIEKRLELQVVLDGMIQIADALNHVHNSKPYPIIHRDIKPDNVLLRVDETRQITQFMLTDFGLSRSLEGNTRTLGVGTLPYMAPEQFGINPEIMPDHRADIYQFGIMLYELCAGRRPFQSSNLLIEIFQEEPTPPSEFVPAIPGDLEDVIMKLIEKEPHKRFQTMDDVRFSLLNIYNHTTDTAHELPSELLNSVRLKQFEIKREEEQLVRQLVDDADGTATGKILYVKTEDGQVYSYAFTTNSATIGRHRDAELRFSVRNMSRHHAKLEQDEQGNIYVTDLNSTHGTYINGEKIPENMRVQWNPGEIMVITGCAFQHKPAMAGNVRTIELGNILPQIKNPKLTISISPEVVHLELGKPQFVKVYVQPENAPSGYYSVQVAQSENIDAQWYVLPAPKLIEAGQATTFDIIVQLPEQIALQQYKYQMVIGVVSDDNEKLGAFQVVNVSVQRYSDIKASLNSIQILHRKRRAARLNIDNDGGFPEVVSINSGSAGMLKVETKQNEYTVPAKDNLSIPLIFKPTSEALKALVVPFYVIVRTKSGNNIRIEATYVTRKRRVPWTLVLVFAVAIIVVYRWFVLGIEPYQQLNQALAIFRQIRAFVLGQ